MRARVVYTWGGKMSCLGRCPCIGTAISLTTNVSHLLCYLSDSGIYSIQQTMDRAVTSMV